MFINVLEKPFYKMTDGQLGVFLECIQRPEALMYNLPISFFIEDNLGIDKNLLIASIKKATESFPVLKSVVSYDEETPVMCYKPELKVEIETHESSKSEAEKMKLEFPRPFDLEEGPLFRFAIYQVEDGFYFLMDIHHLIFDGTSTGIFLKQIANYYEGQPILEEEADLSVLANYEKEYVETSEYAASKQYFDEKLAGIEVNSNIIFDQEESKDKSVQRAANITINLDGGLGQGEVNSFLKKNSITTNTFFLGAYSYALAKFTGQEESLLCTVSHGRFHPKFKNTIGMLVNTLPLYMRINEADTIHDYLLEVQNDLYETVKHQAYSFEKIAKDYGVTTDILFVYQGEMLNDFHLNGNKILLENIQVESSLANLALRVFKKNSGYEVSLSYRADLYFENTMKRFMDMFVMVLKGFMAKSYLMEIPLVSEKDQMLRETFNANDLEFDNDLTVVDLFKEQVKKSPNNVAIVFKEKQISYKELDDLSDALAVYLKKKGIKAEKKVGILVDRSDVFPISFLGILKAGGAYQPLDAKYPKGRLNHMIEDAKMEILILDEDLKELVQDYTGEIIYTKDIYALPMDNTVALERPRPEDLFNLLYTSGSTGLPKGCMLEHKNIMNFCKMFQTTYNITDQSRSVGYGSFGFDAAILDFFPFLTAGASVYILPEEMRLDLPRLDEYFRDNKITNILLTTQMGREYITEYPDNPYIKTLVTGGEKLVSCTPPNYPFENLYGPTECSIFVTHFNIDKAYKNIPIGTSVNNTEIYIVDKYNRELPVMVPGELCVAGYSVSRGYLNNEEQTQSVFVPNPFSKKVGYERIYKTGDVCRYLENGNLEFVGRRDSQIKIRGFRIELSEIEARIRQFSLVKDATVVAKEAVNGEKFIAAYITGKETIDIPQLNDFIMAELPHYMVPAATMQIESIPLNQNGKVDKSKLPEVKLGTNIEEAAVLNRSLTRLEEELVNMVENIVGHKDFEVSTDLMRIGFTSLSTIKFVTTLKKKYGYAPTVNQIMQGATILDIENDMVQYLFDHKNQIIQVKEDRVALQENGGVFLSNEGVPLSKTQLGVYYDELKNPDKLIYNIPVMIKIEDISGADKLINALETVIKAHPYLQTTLKLEGEEIKQFNNPNSKINIEYIKVAEEMIPQIKKDFPQGFNLLDETLYRIKVVETQSNIYIFLDFHHIIFDGASLQILIRELGEAYKGEIPVVEAYSYFDYVKDELEKVNSDYFEEAEQYYASTLANFEGSTEITPDLNGKAEDGRPAQTAFLLNKDKIEDFCKNNALTPAHLLLGGVAYTLSRFTGTKEVHLCTASSGRSNSEIQNTMGMFVQTIPLSMDINSELSCRAYINHVKDVFLKGIEYEEYPFADVATKYNFMANIMYVCQLGILEDKLEIDGKEITMEELELGFPKFKVQIMIEEREGQIGVCLTYNDALYSLELMNMFAESVGTTIENIMTKPESLISATSMVSPKQAEKLDTFHMSAQEEIGEKILHRIFENEVSLYPDKIALLATDGEYTYKELDTMINRVANALVDHGVKVGEKIAILLPRDSRMITALYAVLKAGCAYVPCDTQYPKERINYMIEDSDATYIITTSDRMEDISSGKGINIDELIKYPNTASPEIDVKPDDIAGLLYTSGSTGQPKGSMLAHHGISNYIYNHPTNYTLHAAVEACSTVVSISTFSFDMCLKEIIYGLSNGLRLALANESECTNPILLANLFERTQVEFLIATPSRLLQYMEFPEFCQALEKCKVLLTGGEKCTPQLLAKLKSVTKARLYNVYGPTEATIISNAKELTHEDTISIGKPLTNYYICILDADENELPPGVAGELCIGGPGVAKGYYNLEERTKQSFIKWNGQIIYKSGDYAKWSEDGDVFILGRKDNQVKLRGQRIELEEIETKIAQYKGIKNAVVIIKQINDQDHICTYFTGEETINIEDLKASLKKDLPGYMIPTAFMEIEEMPYTLNGKIDVKKLPEVDLSAPNKTEVGSSKTLNCLEEELVGIASEIVGHTDFGIDTDLIKIGFTSLYTIKLAAIITKKFGHTLVVNKMMQGTTILEIENELLRNWMDNTKEPAVKKEKVTLLEKEGIPLSKTQVGIYYDTMKNPEKLIYNIPVMIKIEDTSNIDKLMNALEVVVKAHPYLQTTLKIDGEEIKQFNNPNDKINMEHIKATEEEISQMKTEFPRSFDILKETLYRIKVVETDKNSYIFLDFHHIIFDGASLQLLMSELQEVYKGEILAPETYSYFDYVTDEIEKEKNGYYQEAKEYYASKLIDFEGSTEIPTDLAGKAEEGKIAETAFLLDKNQIENFCKNNDMTPAHLFLGGAAYTLSRFAGAKDIHLCTVSSGRSNLEIQNTMGMFVQTIPLSMSIPKDLSCRKYIEEVKQIFLKGLEYEAYPFTEISTQYGFTPNIMYGCQLGILEDKLEIDGKRVVMEELDLDFPKFGISIMIEEKEGQIGICLAYNDALYSLDLMNTFAEAMGTAVGHMMQQPESLITDTSIISKKQAERLDEFHISEQVEIEEKVVHRVFENKVLLDPDKKALVATDGEYTYRELDKMINCVANALLDHDVKVGERIAILLPRDSRMIAAMYGIFKAGCAYIPCDPKYPAERISYMIEDSESSYIITTSDRMSSITSGKAINIDDLMSHSNFASPELDIKPDDIACLLYTSGSTGNPKGAMLEHHGICNCVYNHPANILLNATVEECSTVVSIATISFDMCLTEISFALSNGLTLALANEEECTNPVLLADLFDRAKGDFLLATPSRLLEYMEFPEFCTALEQCRVIISGGENYTLQLLNKLRRITKARLYNGYGPTEATMVCNAKELTNETTISIGKPLLNYYICILDADENEVPPGVIGELCIGGPGLAKGYYNLEERTKESFIQWGEQRIYKTGDYAKWSKDGDVFVLGRKDNQVKLRGQRIELGEIETRIAQYKGIKNTVVIIGKINNQDHICTYFTSEEKINLDDLKASLKQDLPGYMVPTAYMELDEMPFTLNGKIDHKLLPKPLIDSEGDYEAPANKVEKALCEIYAKVLALPKVGVLDNFFEKGGTSLVVTRVVIEASKQAIEISYGDVFNYPTPRELAGFATGILEKEDELSASLLEDFSNYNYDQINQVLAGNKLEVLQQGERTDLGNILLTGATGFLGIHVLANYLQNHKGKAYCLLRTSGSIDASKRLKSLFYYYFEGGYEGLFEDRVIVIDGDITNPKSFEQIQDLPVDTVINCAANVKHFSQGTDIEDVNVGGVINIVNYCMEKKARLVHVSTASVSGYSIDDTPAKNTVMSEQMLYFGQDLDNKYIHSKISAERHILQNISLGLKAKILRVGNLSARDSDGEFQINFSTNSFMGSLKSYLMIGKFPYAFINQKVEFSPIDTTAESILLLAQTPDDCCVFHNYNNHIITMGDLIKQMNKMGFEIEFSEMDEFEKAFKTAQQDPEKAKILSSMIAYANMGHGREIVPIATDSEYTLQVLYRLGYKWPITSNSYVEKFMDALNGLGYFDF